MDGLTRISVASAEQNDQGGNYRGHYLDEAAHLKRLVVVFFRRNSTDVLFERPEKVPRLNGQGMEFVRGSQELLGKMIAYLRNHSRPDLNPEAFQPAANV